MQIPIEVTYRGMEKRDSIDKLINDKARKLEEICDYISSCRVAVESFQKQRSAGNRYRVRLDITVPPGHEIIVDKKPVKGAELEPLPTMVRESFAAAKRQLKELVERQKGEVKSHPEQELEAVVAKLFKDEDYGMLESVEGREIYFHRHSVLNNDFDRLEIGTGVRYVQELGDEGLQASTVQIVDKPGSRIKR